MSGIYHDMRTKSFYIVLNSSLKKSFKHSAVAEISSISISSFLIFTLSFLCNSNSFLISHSS